MSLAAWLGLLDPPGQPPDHRPAVLLRGRAAEIDRAWPMVDAALRRRSDYRLVIAVPAAERDVVQRRFSHERVVADDDADRPWRPAPHSRGIALTIEAATAAEMAFETIARLPRVEPPRSVMESMAARLLPALGLPPLGSISAFRDALGDTSTILCLGNGPTSEDSALAACSEATTFRVNWTWRARGRMNNPHAVFTADPDLPPRGSETILVFPNAGKGRLVLAQHMLAMRLPRAGYAFADNLLPAVASQDGQVTPTNGAIMVAMAAALAPGRLVIAGMDLYRHPLGRYPGSDAVEGYARGHSTACDLALIGRALDGFRGKVEILSPNLAEALGR